ncbi:MAG: GAF domain-containing protein [Deltaproteobacteria bacterium]|nr:GAF domain-containing protein [Deltaproteobacteria bacterium]
MDTSLEKRIELLSRVIEISNSNILIENRLKYICDLLSRETGADCVCINRRERRGENLLPWISSCVQTEESAMFEFRIRPGEGVAGKALQKRVPVFFPDVRSDPPSLAVTEEQRDFASILAVPVMDDVYLYGVMNFSTHAPAQYTEETVNLLRIVATEVAGAIRNSRLYHDARKRVSELITLNEIGRAITSTFHVRDILAYVAKTTLRLLQAEGCTVRLAGDGSSALKVMVDEGYSRPGMRRELRAHGKLLANQIFREKRPLLVNGPEDSPMYLPLTRQGITSFLGLPIVSKGKALGVISYYSGSPDIAFDMEVVNLMQTICSQLANMIENSTMYQDAQALAHANQVKVRQLSTLYDVARALMSTVKTERLLQIMMRSLTSPAGLNFSRAILFMVTEDGDGLMGRMGVGPKDRREARRAASSSPGFSAEGETGGKGEDTRYPLWPDAERFSIPLYGSECLVAKAVRERKAVRTETGCGQSVPGSPQMFCGKHPSSFAAVPLVFKDEARGVIYVDNQFREREITDEDIQILTMFASEACLAMENASLYEDLENALENLRAMQSRLVQSEKLAALGEMAAKIAHEIKNPLTVIGGFAARLARKGQGEDPDGATYTRYTRIILKEAQRLERIIRQTLYFSRDVLPARRQIDLNDEIKEVLAMFREDLEEAGIHTDLNLSADLPSISVDPDQLRQVLWNLLSNAIQAMEEGGKLTVATRQATPDEGDGVVFLIGDTGGGIPYDVVHNIFNPFFTTKTKGTGLGLPIVHTIVEKHGGTIQLDNREGKGVTFSVFLPRVPKEAGAEERILEQMSRGGGEGGGGAKNHP